MFLLGWGRWLEGQDRRCGPGIASSKLRGSVRALARPDTRSQRQPALPHEDKAAGDGSRTTTARRFPPVPLTTWRLCTCWPASTRAAILATASSVGLYQRFTAGAPQSGRLPPWRLVRSLGDISETDCPC